jgi:hypothetical protein
MRRRRLALEAPDGLVTVTDLSRPGARLIELELPDGARVRVAEHLCGWAGPDEPGREGPLWPTLGDAVAALSGRTRDGQPWIAVLEEFATALAPSEGEALAPDVAARLAELPARHPALYADGPRAHDGGGWYVFIGGLPGDAWLMEIAVTPAAAALGAIARAEEILDGAGL